MVGFDNFNKIYLILKLPLQILSLTPDLDLHRTLARPPLALAAQITHSDKMPIWE